MTTASLAEAYSATGGAWQHGPGRVYDRLAAEIVGRCPFPLAGARVLDLGAGTGAASRAAARTGASVVATDVAAGMLAFDAASRPPAAVGDALDLPFADRSFAAVVAAFSLNHVGDPASALREAWRVLAPGGWVAVAAYAEDDAHPVKGAVEGALADRGWQRPRWYDRLRVDSIPLLATVERAEEAAAAAGIAGATALHLRVAFPDLSARDLVEWRLGMAQVAPFLRRLAPSDRAAVVDDALARLGTSPPPLVRAVILLTATRASR